MNLSFKKNITCFLIFVMTSLSVYAQNNYATLIEKYRKIYQSEIKKNKVIGYSIALISNDSIIWVESFGYRDKAKKIKATDNDQYLIGSVTKTFTGIGVMQLQQQGKLNIDDPFKKFLPDFNIKMLSGDINDIKIRQMMTHHSGIQTDVAANMFSKDPEPLSKLLDYVNNDYLALPPGLSLSYSNTAVSLLGLMIEKVSSISYQAYIKTNLFDPLEMHSTGFYSTDDIPEGVKYTYDYKGNFAGEAPIRDIPAGAIYSTVPDLANYIRSIAHYGRYKNSQILDSVSMAAMFETQNSHVKLDLGLPIGLSWFIGYNDAGKYVFHDGGTLHSRSYMAVAPESKVGVVVLSNSDNGGNFNWRATELMAELAKIKGFKATRIPDPDSVSSHYYTNSNKEKFKKVKISKSDLSKYTGVYSSGSVGCVKVFEKGNNLKFNFYGYNFNLVPVSGNNFLVRLNLLGFIPITDKNQIIYFDTVDSRKLLISRYVWGSKYIIGEFQKTTELPPIWKKRLGNYQSVNVKESSVNFINISALELKDSILTIKVKVNVGYPSTVNLPLNIISNNLAEIYGTGRYGGMKLQVIKKEDGSENLLFSGIELKKE